MRKPLFRLTERRTTLRTEVLGGVTTFATMAYIIVVNPAVLSFAGFPTGPATVATIIVAAFDSSAESGAWAVAVLLVVTGLVLGAITLFGTARLVALMTIHHLKLGGTIAPDRIVAVQPLDQEQKRKLRWIVPGLLVVLAVSVVLTLFGVEDELNRLGHQTSVTAHRGSSIEAPQNSMAAQLMVLKSASSPSLPSITAP